MTSKPVALILAGPNGAGKTTVSSVFVGPDVEFVNADIIGADLRRDDPNRAGADVTAGRIVSARLRALTAERRRFCFETNLASPGLVGRVDAWRADGYEVKLTFISLANVDLALTRVARRVAVGGHDIPEETVRRRFAAGLRYFLHALSVPSGRVGPLRQRCWSGAHRERPTQRPERGRARPGGVCGITGKGRRADGIQKWETGAVSQAQVTDVVDLDADMVARHLEWQRAMQEAVARALDEHRANGRSIAVLREGKVITLAPSQY